MERGVRTGPRIEAAPLAVSADMSQYAMTERILGVADRAGYRAAVIDAGDGTVTAWPRFAWMIRAAAHSLARRGLADGATAGVLVPDAAHFAIAVRAIRAAGAIALPIRPDASLAEVAGQLNASGVRLLITAASLAGLAADAADRSRVRQIVAFGDAAGTIPFRSLLTTAEHAGHESGPAGADESAPDPLTSPARSASPEDGRAGLSYRDVVVAAPPCGDGRAYTSLLDLALLAGATIVAAPVPLVTAAIRVYKGTAAIIPRGASVLGVPPDRIFAVALSGATD